ncbi:glycosyltransferase family 4 protein [Pontibacter virosus]|uniref:Glycosyltransferase involved in cell wall biosynthesis n=1 Tax=Pontibacter virosus TaxID=1765052 RepID=A0A2U1B2X8_9BACT|nr:glycosyltransferase [Pontibacter virosus]PVY43025.1 glycosyltransferase involved in cell wall biosynthesis [Pontibacter virosus]
MDKTPTVLYVVDSLLMGGTEISTIDIASELRDFKPIICYIYQNSTLRSLAESRGLELIHLNIPGRYNFQQAYKSLLEVTNKVAPAVIVSSLLRSDLLCRFVAKKAGIALIGTFVSDNYSDNRFKNTSLTGSMKIKTFKLINQLTVNRCAHIISNSEAIKVSNCKILKYPKDKVSVVPRGRSSKKYSFEKKFNSERTVFLNVNRLIGSKRVDLLIMAFAKHSESHPNDELLIAGDGNERISLQNMIDSLNISNKVKILGKVSDVPSLMQHADCLVFPSNLEGFSGVLVEALMSGLPVLASDISMNKEAISHLNNGYLFAVNDLDSLTQALGWFKDNHMLAVKMATDFRSEAHERYDIVNVAARHERIYKEVIGN